MPIDQSDHPLTTHTWPWPPPCTHRMQAYQLSNTAASAVRNGAVVFNAVTQWVTGDTSGLGYTLQMIAGEGRFNGFGLGDDIVTKQILPAILKVVPIGNGFIDSASIEPWRGSMVSPALSPPL